MKNRRSFIGILGAVLGIGLLVALGFVMSGWFRAMRTTRESAPVSSRSQPVSPSQKKNQEQTPSPPTTSESSERADPTADWERFFYPIPAPVSKASKSTGSGRLSILYPPSMSAQMVNDRTVTVKPINPTETFGSGDFSVAVTTHDPESLSLQEFVDRLTLPGPSTGIHARSSVDPITVAGLSGFRVIATGVGGNNLGVFLSFGGQIISITASYAGQTNDEYVHLFDLMVGSLTLI